MLNPYTFFPVTDMVPSGPGAPRQGQRVLFKRNAEGEVTFDCILASDVIVKAVVNNLVNEF